MTLIGVPRETAAGERRVALVPKVVERLQAAGVAVVVETGAGTGALIPDEQYEQAGAPIGDPWPADLVVKVNPPTADEIGLLSPNPPSLGSWHRAHIPRSPKACAWPASPALPWRRFRGFRGRR